MQNLSIKQELNGSMGYPIADSLSKESSETPKSIPKPNFYKISGKGKNITIDLSKLVKILEGLDFRRLDTNDRTLIIRVVNNIVEEYPQMKIVDVFEEYLDHFGGIINEGESYSIPKEVLRDKIYKGISTYFSDHILYRLKREPNTNFIQDTKNCSYFFYRNGVIKITASAIEILSYKELKNQKIWKYQILDSNISICEYDKIEASAFFQFAQNISSLYQKNNNIKRVDRLDLDRFNSLKSIVGYSLHNFFGGKKKAVIFTDSSMGDDSNGRTGKTLLTKAMGRMLNPQLNFKRYVELNGKDFDPKDRFKYQEARRETRLVHINDAKANLNFELLFNDVSEGIKAQRKNAEPFFVGAKMIISTNQTVKIQGDSAKDRCLEYEMSNYYNAKFSPASEFGHWFFDDWNEEQWNIFYNFMFHCVQNYLQGGLINAAPMNLNKRKLVNETSQEFVTYLDDLEKLDGLGEAKELDKSILYKNFIIEYPDFKSVRQRTFTKWCKLYTEYNPKFEGTEERKGGGKYFIQFIPVNNPSPF